MLHSDRQGRGGARRVLDHHVVRQRAILRGPYTRDVGRHWGGRQSSVKPSGPDGAGRLLVTGRQELAGPLAGPGPGEGVHHPLRNPVFLGRRQRRLGLARPLELAHQRVHESGRARVAQFLRSLDGGVGHGVGGRPAEEHLGEGHPDHVEHAVVQCPDGTVAQTGDGAIDAPSIADRLVQESASQRCIVGR